MQRTIKTQSPKIGTALPFEEHSERTDSVVEVTHRTSSVLPKSAVSGGSRYCPYCGAEIGFRNQQLPRIVQLIMSCLCVMLLIVIVLFAGRVLNSWAKNGFEIFADHFVWHEPLDDWNL